MIIHCRSCSYQLTGLRASDGRLRCPECGTLAWTADDRAARRRLISFLLITIAPWLLLLGALFDSRPTHPVVLAMAIVAALACSVIAPSRILRTRTTARPIDVRAF